MCSTGLIREDKVKKHLSAEILLLKIHIHKIIYQAKNTNIHRLQIVNSGQVWTVWQNEEFEGDNLSYDNF